MDFIEEFDQSINLWSQDINTSFENSSPETLYKLIETLSLSIKYHLSPSILDTQNENFSFIANTSLSGGRHPCSYIDCRASKLDGLVSFASLYADVVYIRNPFEYIYHSWNEHDIEYIKYEMLVAIQQYLYLKPYLVARIIKYSCSYVDLCSEHHETLAKPLYKKIEDKEKKLYSEFENHLLSNCIISLDKFKNGQAFIELIDKTGLIEHGKSYLHFYDKSKSKSKHLRKLIKSGKKHVLTKSEIEQEELLSMIIGPSIYDILDQEWTSYFYDSSILFDNKQKYQIAGKMNEKIASINSEAFNDSISHYLPTIHSRDPLEIIKLRTEEEESFKVYRDKLHKLLMEAPKHEGKVISDIFRDTVLPEINLINKKIKDFQVKKQTAIRDKLIFGSGAVTFGLYSGMLPSNLGSILAAIGGGSAIVSTMIDYTSSFRSKDEARANDYYFLWELTR